jgi:pimeloyl-ACP methyl ester carboxylesterase
VGDISAFLDLQEKTGWTLAGHSLGAATALMAAMGRRDISSLALIEPVALPQWLATLAKTPAWLTLARRTPLVRMASRRRNHWPDRTLVTASYKRKALFKAWAPGVLEDYLCDGLEEQAEGVSLACDPVWEAATFSAQANDFWAAVRAAPAPVRIFAADHPTSTVSGKARQRFQGLGAILTVKSGVTHMAPMENPAHLAAFLAGSGESEAKSAQAQ